MEEAGGGRTVITYVPSRWQLSLPNTGKRQSEEASQAAGGQAPLPRCGCRPTLPVSCLHCGSPDSQLIAALVSITVITIICFHLAPAHFLTRKAACLSPLLCPRMLPTGLPVLKGGASRKTQRTAETSGYSYCAFKGSREELLLPEQWISLQLSHQIIVVL